MQLLWGGLLLLILMKGISAQQDIIIAKCCTMGISWAEKNFNCDKFIKPLLNIDEIDQSLCHEIVDTCCRKSYQRRYCEIGKFDARKGVDCNQLEIDENNESIDIRRDCCEGCKLGIKLGSSGSKSCSKKSSFSESWDQAFNECCEENVNRRKKKKIKPAKAKATTSTSSTTDTTEDEEFNEIFKEITYPTLSTQADLCQLMKGLLCEDICVPTAGSYYCKCHDGSTLQADGRSCETPTTTTTTTTTTEKPSTTTKSTPKTTIVTTTKAPTTKKSTPKVTTTKAPTTTKSTPKVTTTKSTPKVTTTKSTPKVTTTKSTPKVTTTKSTPKVTTKKVPKTTKSTPKVTTKKTPKTSKSTPKVTTTKSTPKITTTKAPKTTKSTPKVTTTKSPKITTSRASKTTKPKPKTTSTKAPKTTSVKPTTKATTKPSTKKNTIPSSPLTIMKLLTTGAKLRTTRALTTDDNELNQSCPTGYRFNPESNTCDDIDECYELQQACSMDTICRNTNGSYDCIPDGCEFGYRWNSTFDRCVDVDECLENTHKCMTDYEICKNLDGSFECEIKCETGYVYSGFYSACLDINECSELANPCPQLDTICVNTQGSYDCKTFNDYSQSFNDSNLSSTIARNNQSSSDYDGINDEGICAYGFTYNTDVKSCDDIDECELLIEACSPNEICRNTPGGYDCIPAGCHRGFILVNDSCIDIDECNDSLHACLTNEVCRNTNGSFTCEPPRSSPRPSTSERPAIICRKGYKADYKVDGCVDIDECVEGPGCRDHERCFNFQGSYDCSPLCGQGWYFHMETKSCQDVDECLLGHHNCRQRTQYCRNTNGSYICEPFEVCTSGYRRSQNGSCIDVDECQESLHSCSRESHRYCVNLEGGYECITRLPSCSSGFEYSLLTHNCEDIDECRTGKAACDSKLNERCINVPGTYRCERPIPQLRRVRPACPNGTRYDIKLRMCADIDECMDGSHNCGREKCYNLPGSYECAKAVLPVIKRRTTTTVEMGSRSNGDDNCSAGSKYDSDRGGCVDIDECNENKDVCGIYEDCINTPSNFECHCKLGFRRDNFTQACVDVNECIQENGCLSYQRCDNTIGSYTCVRFLSCGTGYTLNAATEICEDDDECAMGTHDCPKGYKCFNTLGSFRCHKIKKTPADRLRTTTWPSKWTTRGSHYYGFPSPQRTTTPAYRPVTTTTTEMPTTTPQSTTTSTTTTTTTPQPSTTYRTWNVTARPSGNSTYRPWTSSTYRPWNTTVRPQWESTYRPSNTTVRPTWKSTYRPWNTTVRPQLETTYRPLNTTARPQWESTYRPWNTTSRPTWQSSYRPWNTTYKPKPTPRYYLNTTIYIPPIRARPTTTTEFIPTVGPVVTSRNWDWTTTRSPMTCPPGYESGSSGQCIDINECQRNARICGTFKCINFMGSYKCENKMLCPVGHRADPISGECKDIDECTQRIHECGPYQQCQNIAGGYFCYCPQGYEIRGKECIDVDECSRYTPSGICGTHGRCENIEGSYRCTCEAGFMNDPKSKACIDLDECTSKSNLCEHQCYNTWGGHRCGCHYGYRLKADNRSCEDIDECNEFKDNHLCIGLCDNTPGSYSCKCPEGYKIADDGRTCQDIDECATNQVCRGSHEICQNVRGSYRCNKIICPNGYVPDPQRKNRCMRESPFCPVHDTACFNRPAHYTYNYIAMVSMFPMPSSGEVDLFVMRGAYNVPDSTVRFSMAFITARAPPNVRSATEECFSLKHPYPSQAILAMTQSLQGPQDIELDLSMEIYSPTGEFAGSAVAKIFIVITQYEF